MAEFNRYKLVTFKESGVGIGHILPRIANQNRGLRGQKTVVIGTQIGGMKVFTMVILPHKHLVIVGCGRIIRKRYTQLIPARKMRKLFCLDACKGNWLGNGGHGMGMKVLKVNAQCISLAHFAPHVGGGIDVRREIIPMGHARKHHFTRTVAHRYFGPTQQKSVERIG